jgi:AcrR family transcriptional regulator
MPPRPDVSEERRSQILEAASAVFARLGFHQARMDDIAQEAGLSKGALYLYYNSKDAIIAALLRFFFDQELGMLRRLLQAGSEQSAREQLLMVNRRMGEAMKWMEAMRPIAFEFYAIAARQKNVRQFLKEYFKEYRELLAVLIQRGVESGEFKPLDAQSVAITVAALYEGLVLLWMVDPQAVQWEKASEESLRLLLGGLQNHRGD